jgi:CRP-like cAMP-binding protein
MFESLVACPVFKGISEEELKRILQNKHHFQKVYSKGEMVAQAKEPCDHLMCVVEGSVKGEMVDFSGKTIKIEDIQAPRVLATAFLFGKNNRYPVNIIANEHCSIFYLPRSEFTRILRENEIVLLNYLNAISDRGQFLSQKIRFLSFKTIKGKIAHYLLSHQKDDNMTIILTHTQQQLSELFGVARPSLARALGELEEQGIIMVERKTILISDIRGLRKLREG